MAGLAPCVAETVTVNGTGTITLSGTAAGNGLQTFYSGFGSSGASNVQYKILGTTSNAWETGLGTFSGGNPGTLTRTFINSSTGSAINFSSEVCTVSCDLISDANGNIPISGMPIGTGPSQLVPYGTNYAVLGYLNNSGTSNLTTTANRQSFVPFQVAKPTVISNLGCIVTTGSSGTTFSTGVYAYNNNSGGTGNLPTGSPLFSVTGLSSATAGAVIGSIGTPYTLLPNVVYWRSFIQSAAVSMKVIAIGGETGALGLGSVGSVVTGYYLAGSGTTLISPFSGTPLSGVTSAWPLNIYS